MWARSAGLASGERKPDHTPDIMLPEEIIAIGKDAGVPVFIDTGSIDRFFAARNRPEHRPGGSERNSRPCIAIGEIVSRIGMKKLLLLAALVVALPALADEPAKAKSKPAPAARNSLYRRRMGRKP